MDLANSHKDSTIKDWKEMILSYGTKTDKLSSDGRKWSWKLPGEGFTNRLAEGTLKHGGSSVMVGGCTSWDGIGYACKIDGRMDKELYTQILEEDLQQSLGHYGLTPAQIIFQQDNKTKYTSKLAKSWFKYHGI